MKNQSIIRILCGDNDSYESEQKDNNMLTQATYNRKQATLSLTYNGVKYRYYNIPKFVYNQLAEASSIDEYYITYIQNKYQSEKC
jgi:hypothetical protein